jgi:predicted PurR-regulated permease PerM
MQNKSKYLIIGLILALIALAWIYLKSIIIYVAIALIISLIGQPLVKMYGKFKVGKFKLPITICALLSLATIALIVTMLVSMFIPLIVKEARIISQINPNEVVTTFKEPLKNLEYDLQKFQINYGNGESIEKFLASQLTSILGFQEISNIASEMIGFTTGLIGGTFAILFMAFFFMKDEHLIYRAILLLTPPKHLEPVKEILRDTKRLLTRYFIGILLDMLFVATLTSIGLTIIGVENALLIGMFAGLINIIPYIGPLIGVSFGLLIGITSNLEMNFYVELIPLLGKICITFLIVQLLDALFFQPMVISNIVKAHPLEIFIVILIAGTLAGIGGMIVAVPIYTILRIIAKEFLSNFQVVQKLTSELDEHDSKK